MISVLAVLLSTGNAEAACEHYVRKASKLSGKKLVQTFKLLQKCDKSVAEDNFIEFLKRAKDPDTLVALSATAIVGEVSKPVWKMPNKIPDYNQRKEIVQRIGAKCKEDKKFVSFVQGAYYTLGDNDYTYWGDAYLTCESAELDTWLIETVENPPEKTFDDKYNTLMGAFVKKNNEKALPHLEKAAIKAAKNGPYNDILTQLESSVEPSSIGGSITPENQQALANALMNIAKEVKDPLKSREVADKLAGSGSEAQAAELLKTIFPNRYKNGKFTYGVAAIETADCDGTKTAVIHYSEVTDPGKRWFIVNEVEKTLRANKAKLKKCKSIDSTWPISITPEPVASAKDISKWVEEISAQYKKNEYGKVSKKKEKKINLD